jgi:hypothetical protein
MFAVQSTSLLDSNVSSLDSAQQPNNLTGSVIFLGERAKSRSRVPNTSKTSKLPAAKALNLARVDRNPPQSQAAARPSLGHFAFIVCG